VFNSSCHRPDRAHKQLPATCLFQTPVKKIHAKRIFTNAGRTVGVKDVALADAGRNASEQGGSFQSI
jgi:hypothetical protein